MNRKYNFYAGPATLPFPILEQLRDEMVEYHGEGMSMIETSHRSPMYENMHQETISLLRGLMGIPDEYHVLFLGGGATLQFGMIPLNLLTEGKSCEYTLSGFWAKKAFSDAQKIGKAKGIFDGNDTNYTNLPDPQKVIPSVDSAYMHLTSNETIGGVQWKDFPHTGSVPLVADMSSDILSKHIDVKKFGIIYAGAQKNIGPAGVTIVIIRKDLVEQSSDKLPVYLSYKSHAENNSLYNTPPVFSIYAVHHVLKLLKDTGGIPSVELLNRKKSDTLYAAINNSGGFYTCPVNTDVRSDMNVVFRLPSEALEEKFILETEKLGMVGLKGHRNVGGCRASIYNAMPLEGVVALTDFMKDFAKRQG